MPTGRATSAMITSRLRAALEGGRALTYAELAREARCTERSVRNYLDEAMATLGHGAIRERGPDRKVRVRGAGDATTTIDELGRVLAKEMLRRVFPLAGTSLGRAPKHPRASVIVAVRGAYQYEERHLRLLRDWLQAANARPRRATSFDYDGSEKGLRVVWPLGIVVRDLARVYWLGIPAEAENARDVRTYALERVRSARVATLPGDESGPPPRGIESAPVDEALDLPFSILPGAGGVHVHVRFTPAQARFMRGRLWHKNQRMKTRRDGSLEVEFGPADEGEVRAWLAQWGDSVTVIGGNRRDGP
jgi:predicted DNA-binding transcriptional regulator YafY